MVTRFFAKSDATTYSWFLWRELITIDGSKVSYTGSGTELPLMLNINLPGVKAAGADVRLAHLDGTPMAREIESKDVPNADDVTIHYPFDTIASTDSQFWIYWGNPNLTEPAEDSTYGREAVWASTYVAVWHMNIEPNGAGSGFMIDSTSNDNDAGAPAGFDGNSLVTVNGELGINFDGTEQIPVGFTNFPTGNSARTIIYRVRPTTLSTNFYVPFVYGKNVNQQAFQAFIENSNPGKMWANSYGTSSDANAKGSTALTAGNKRTLTYTFDGAASPELEYFLDGSTDGTASFPAELNTVLDYARIGRGHVDNYYWIGDIYEIRVVDSILSDNYIDTTHNNLNNPTATGTLPFYKSFGNPQHQRRTSQIIN